VSEPKVSMGIPLPGQTDAASAPAELIAPSKLITNTPTRIRHPFSILVTRLMHLSALGPVLNTIVMP
jgi:hypothetical protein